MREYVVQHGDSLSSIAEKMLGTANRWPEIAKLNRIQSVNLLFVGLKLSLPERTAVSGTTALPGPIGVQDGNFGLSQMTASMAMARGFMFIVFEQLPDVGAKKIIRKVAAIPRDFSLKPENPLGTLSPAEHALASNPSKSQFLSGSNRPFGAAGYFGADWIADHISPN